MPCEETCVRRCDKQGVIHSLHTLGDFDCKQAAHNEAEPPLQPGTDSGDERYEEHGLSRSIGYPCDAGQHPLDRRSEGQAVPCY